MIRTRSLRVALAVSALALLVAGCSSSGGSGKSGGGSGKGSLKGKTIALVGYGNSNAWGAAFNKQFRAKLANSGLKIKNLTTMDSGTQIQYLNQAVAEHPSLIVLAALDTKATAVPIRKAKQAGVPVLVFDGPTDPSVANDVMSVLSDNEKLGEFAAQNLIDGLKAQGRDSGKIIVLEGTKSMLVTQDRMTGFNKVMAAAPQYKVIDVQDANWDPTLSGKVAQQLLAKYGCSGVQAAYGMADYMALPIVKAAQQAGCAVGGKRGLIITGGNCFKAGIDAIKSGQLFGTATEDPISIAKQTADYVVQYLSGQKPPQKQLVNEFRVTKENVSQYAAQCSQA
jgi:ABC-type sugar transport system substrate-binding protein